MNGTMNVLIGERLVTFCRLTRGEKGKATMRTRQYSEMMADIFKRRLLTIQSPLWVRFSGSWTPWHAKRAQSAYFHRTGGGPQASGAW